MLPVPLSDKSRTLGAPSNWDADVSGECMSLDIADREHDGLPYMYSAWRGQPGEIEALVRGAPLFLRIQGVTHPVVSVFVQDPPAPKSAAHLAADIGRAVALSVQARLEVSAAIHPDRKILLSPPCISAAAVAIEFVLVSPLEIVPPEFADWTAFGPFAPAKGVGQ